MLWLLACWVADDVPDGEGPDSEAVDSEADTDPDSELDDTEDTACDLLDFFWDLDGDAWGGEAGSACELPDEAVLTGGDCDDGDQTVFPGAADTWYDGVDSDCAGDADDDADGDGQRPPEHYADGTDCDDQDPSVYLDAPEVCDEVDSDCDGLIEHCLVLGESEGDFSLIGAEGQRVGAALFVVDVDGQPGVEVLVGSWEVGTELSSVYLVRPTEAGLVSDGSIASIDEAEGGHRVGAIGGGSVDIDGDLQQDLVLVDYGGAYGAGRVELYLGPVAGQPVPTEAWEGDSSERGLMAEVSEDVDGDGLGELLVFGSDGGRGELWSGPLDGAAIGLGSGVYGVRSGDIDGDGLAEVGLGRPELGVAFFLEDPTADVEVEDADLVIGSDSYYGIGRSYGDLDGDGHVDLVLHNYDTAGSVWVFLGPLDADRDDASADAWSHGSEGDKLGFDVAIVPDMDDNGTSELAISAPGVGLGTVAVWLDAPSGALDTETAPLRLRSPASSGFYGVRLAGGDVDGDGCAELFIGDVASTVGGAAAGELFVLLGGVL